MSIAQLIGNTPVLEYAPHRFAKLEGFNPAGSSKDRVARSILLGAEKEGRLQPGGAIVEPTSGNTGIALAAIGAARGYRVILTMPDTMSVERQNLIRAYGGEVVLTPGEAGMQGAIDRAQALLGEIPGAILAGQFDNPLNPQAHFETTGPELARQIGDIAALVACVGTGGTLTGTARYLKTLYPHLRVVAVEPAGSPVLSGGRSGAHKIQGIGAGFVPKTLDLSLVDQILTVTDEEAYEAVRAFRRATGLLVGISSGAALFAAGRVEVAGNIAVILPDSGERYLSVQDLWQ